jgi:hypothetical protein
MQYNTIQYNGSLGLKVEGSKQASKQASKQPSKQKRDYGQCQLLTGRTNSVG